MAGAVGGIIGGVIQGVGSIAGADLANTAAQNAAREQAASEAQAQAMNWLMYQQGREDVAPWRNAGYGALNELSQLYGLGEVAPSGTATLSGMPQRPEVSYAKTGFEQTYGQLLPDFMAPRLSPAGSGVGQVTIAGQPAAQGAQGIQTSGAAPGQPGVQGNAADIARLQSQLSAAESLFARNESGPGMIRDIMQQNINKLRAQLQAAESRAVPAQQVAPAAAPAQAQAAPALTREQAQQAALARFKTSPGYSFRLSEGINALDRSAAARGRLLSGAQYKGVQRFGEGLAADEYNTYTNRLAALAGLGQTSSGQSANLAQAAGQYGAGIAMQGGADRASGYINQSNVLNQGIQGVGNAFQNYLQNQQQQQYTQQMQGYMQGQQGGQPSSYSYPSYSSPTWQRPIYSA